MKVDIIIEKQIRDLFTSGYGIIIKNFFFYNSLGFGENRKVEKFEDIPDSYFLEFCKEDSQGNSVLLRILDQINCDEDTIKVCITDKNSMRYNRKAIPINKNNLEEFILRTVILGSELW